MAVNPDIGNSGLLITRTLHGHKHQLSDFFNRHRRLHKYASLVRPLRVDERNGDGEGGIQGAIDRKLCSDFVEAI